RPIKITPASSDTKRTPCGPCDATTGTSTTVMAPVGPETCRLEPPKIAATAPAMIAVMRPACAPMPEVTPNASAKGSATIATVRPAMRSCRHVLAAGLQSFSRGKSAKRFLTEVLTFHQLCHGVLDASL